MTRMYRFGAGVLCPLVLGVVLAGALQQRLAAAAAISSMTYVVNVITDKVDANTADNVCDSDAAVSGSQCTLRAAIQQANAHGGQDTIVLSGGLTYTLAITGVGEFDAAVGDLDISDDVTIIVSTTAISPQPFAVVDAQQLDRVFHIVQGQTEISGVLIYNGHTDDSHGGGGILNDGTLIMVNSRVISNSATNGGGILSDGTLILTNTQVLSNSAVSGGGLYNYVGQLFLMDTTIEGNTALYLGGGLHNDPGSVMHMNGGAIVSNTIVSAEGYGAGLANANVAELYQVLVQGNWISSTDIAIGAGLVNYNGGTLSFELSPLSANWIQGTFTNSGNGGGLHNANNSHAIMISSTVEGNHAFIGGGIQNDGLMTITASSIYSNDAINVGGGIANVGDVDPLAQLVMMNSAIVSNTSQNHAGGIRNDGALSLYHVTVVRNVADADHDGTGEGGGIGTGTRLSASISSTIFNSIIGLNIDASPVVTHRIATPDCQGMLVIQGYGLLQNSQGCLVTGTLGGALIGVDPRLGELQDNGGDTWSVQPLFGSPLVDGGPAQPCVGAGQIALLVDQRGYPRPLDARCDIGAIETANLVKSQLFLPALHQ